MALVLFSSDEMPISPAEACCVCLFPFPYPSLLDETRYLRGPLLCLARPRSDFLLSTSPPSFLCQDASILDGAPDIPVIAFSPIPLPFLPDYDPPSPELWFHSSSEETHGVVLCLPLPDPGEHCAFPSQPGRRLHLPFLFHLFPLIFSQEDFAPPSVEKSA